jgi:L-serine dehydratase
VHISVFDIFKIGIGPSSSHTVGPMRAARRFAELLVADGLMPRVEGIKVELFGSLGFTGKGHGSDRAIVLGLEGEDPASVEVDAIARRVAAVEQAKRIKLLGTHEVAFDPSASIAFHRRDKLPLHANGMRFTALGPVQLGNAASLAERIYYSVGGGFVVDHAGAPAE